MPRPIGTAIPESPLVRLASLSTASDVTGSTGNGSFAIRRAPQVVFPEINRSGKGDRLVPSTPAQPEPASIEEQASPPAENPAPSFSSSRPKAAEIDHTDSELPDAQAVVLAELGREAHRRNAPAAAADEIAAAMHFAPFPEYDISLSLELDPKIVEDTADVADLDPTEFTPNAPPSLEGLNAEMKDTRLYFGIDTFGTSLGGIKPWATGEEPRISADPDMKQAAAPAVAAPGVTVAGKGEVTGAGSASEEPGRAARPPRPEARQGREVPRQRGLLRGAQRAGARPDRGRPGGDEPRFSGFYPNDVCGVVYQNAHRHLACQFTFACDGIADVVNDQESWERAKRISRETLDGKLWLPEIAKATHYHASYVNPYWVRAMKKNAKIGLHHFYRPRKWGDGSDAPSWGSATYTADAAAEDG